MQASGTSRSTAATGPVLRRGVPRPPRRASWWRLPRGHHQPQLQTQEFKSGAARMAIAADVPIVPHIVGRPAIWTKDHPRKMWRPWCRSPSRSASRSCRRCPPPSSPPCCAFAHAAPARSRSRTPTAPIRPVSSGCRTGSVAGRRRAARRRRRRPRGRRAERATEGRPGRDGASGKHRWAVFRTLEFAASIATRAAGTADHLPGAWRTSRTRRCGDRDQPPSFIDFLPAALAAHRRHRRMRFMIKAE